MDIQTTLMAMQTVEIEEKFEDECRDFWKTVYANTVSANLISKFSSADPVKKADRAVEEFKEKYWLEMKKRALDSV